MAEASKKINWDQAIRIAKDQERDKRLKAEYDALKAERDALERQRNEYRSAHAALEREVERLREALETIKRRINQYDDMDDATLLAWIEEEADRALARFTREEN